MKALGLVAAASVAVGLVFCPVCQELGLKSRVFPAMSSTCTTMAYQSYYDEDGKWVDEDPNTCTREHRCSRGHRWVEVTQYGKTEVVIKEPEQPAETIEVEYDFSVPAGNRVRVSPSGSLNMEAK